MKTFDHSEKDKDKVSLWLGGAILLFCFLSMARTMLLVAYCFCSIVALANGFSVQAVSDWPLAYYVTHQSPQEHLWTFFGGVMLVVLRPLYGPLFKRNNKVVTL